MRPWVVVLAWYPPTKDGKGGREKEGEREEGREFGRRLLEELYNALLPFLLCSPHPPPLSSSAGGWLDFRGLMAQPHHSGQESGIRMPQGQDAWCGVFLFSSIP